MARYVDVLNIYFGAAGGVVAGVVVPRPAAGVVAGGVVVPRAGAGVVGAGVIAPRPVAGVAAAGLVPRAGAALVGVPPLAFNRPLISSVILHSLAE